MNNLWFDLARAGRDLKTAGIDPGSPVPQEQLTLILQEVGKVFGEHSRRLSTLEKQLPRIDHIEKTALTWRGDWQADTLYPLSTVVRHNGGVYVALLENIGAEPGTAGAPWEPV